MANTNLLKTVIEKEMISTFCDKHGLQPLNLTRKQIFNIFNDMEPDLVAFNRKQKTLYIGEVTASGYMGQRGKDFHVGAVKKVSEAFSKFYLFHEDIDNIIERTLRSIPGIEIDAIKCFFIVPYGSRFINALGYRQRLFQKGYMSLEEIKLSKETHQIMVDVLSASKNENKV